MAELTEMMRTNIQTMNLLEGFDVVVICCSSSFQAEYWQKRLEEGRGSILPLTSVVLAVQEDWPGGAGNGKLINHILHLSFAPLFQIFRFQHLALCMHTKMLFDWPRKRV